jgi:hypothetical protein
MALPLLNNAESQTSGTTVTTANSGGTNATAVDEAPIGANMTMTYDSGVAANGTNGFKIALTSTATAITYMGWTATPFGSAVATLYGSISFRIHSAVASSIRWIAFFNGSTLAGYLGLVNGMQGAQWRSSADAAIGTISNSSNLLVADTLYRCEFQITGGASGAGTAKIYSGNGTTQYGADATFSATSFGTTFNHVRFGCCTANFSSTSGTYLAMDDVNFNSTGLPGPPPYGAAAAALRASPKVITQQAVARGLSRCQRMVRHRSGIFVPAEWHERLVVA